MDKSNINKATKSTLTKEIATRQSDPNFYGALSFLPNPDPVLRKLGKSQEAYEAISYDAHVIGELRSVQAGMLSFEYRVQPVSEDNADMRAKELCQLVMQNKPSPGMRWPDIIWQMALSTFKGYSVHEVTWKRDGQLLLPHSVLDKPNRRFVYGTNNELRLRSKNSMYEGEELGDKKWLVTRHMPSYENPYGVAVFSSCFWPYIFKHNGFKYFSKFCERFGTPWVIGKYPLGTEKDKQDEMLDNLAAMVEDAIAVIPDDGSIELLTSKSSGQLPQERLIQICNSEMSKALTSQTLATEIQGEGSRAASETHREREKSVNESDRETICDTMNQFFAWITELNILGAKPPTFEFYEEEDVHVETAEFIDKASTVVDIPKEWAYRRLQIPMPKDGEEVIERRAPQANPGLNQDPNPEFSTCPNCGGTHDFNQHDDDLNKLVDQSVDGADQIIEQMANPIKTLLADFEKDGKSLQDFQDELVKMYPGIDSDRLAEHTRDVLLLGMLQGMDK